MSIRPLFLIPVNLKDEIDLFLKTKEKVESSFDVELGAECIELYSEEEIDSNLRKIEGGEDIFDYSRIKDVKIGEVHSIFLREPLTTLTVKDNIRYLEHSMKIAKQLLQNTDNSRININSHLGYFIHPSRIDEFHMKKDLLRENCLSNYRSACRLLPEGISLTVENMDIMRWFKTGNDLGLMPLDTSMRDLASVCGAVNFENFGMCFDIGHHKINEALISLATDEEKSQLARCFSLNSFDDFLEFIGDDDYVKSLVNKDLVKSMHISNFKGIEYTDKVNQHGTVNGLLNISEAKSFVDLAQKKSLPLTMEVPMSPKFARKAGFFESPADFLRVLGF